MVSFLGCVVECQERLPGSQTRPWQRLLSGIQRITDRSVDRRNRNAGSHRSRRSRNVGNRSRRRNRSVGNHSRRIRRSVGSLRSRRNRSRRYTS